MDDKHNQDGLNGMPLEPWMSQQHLASIHPSLSSQIYNPALHDYMSHRALQTFTSVEPMHCSPQSISSSALQHYGLSSTVCHQQPDLGSVSQDRSAWSHLLSMDPTVTAMGPRISEPQESLRHYLTQDPPHFIQNTRQDQLLLLKGNTKLTSFDNKSLPKMQYPLASSSTASNPFDNYSQLPGLSPSQNKISQFTQLMNMSKIGRNVTKPPPPKTLTISNDVSLLESSGSYSPVSPPTTDLDEPVISNSGPSIGRVPELFMRDIHDMPSATFPLISSPEPADIFNYLTEKTDPFSSDFNIQDSFSEPMQPLNVSRLLTEISDVPLDMTTPVASKASKGNDIKESSQINDEIISSSDSIINEKTTQMQTPMVKHKRDFLSDINVTSFPGKNQSKYLFLGACNEKTLKPIKSTPKKSNFYGRDASLFSFEHSSSINSDTQSSSTHTLTEQYGADVKENKNLLSVECIEAASMQKDDKSNDAAEDKTVIFDEVKSNIEVNDSGNIAKSPIILLPETVTDNSTSSANTQVLNSLTDQDLNDDTLTEPLETTETALKQDVNSLDKKNFDLSDFKCVLNSNGNIMISGADGNEVQDDENVNLWNEKVDVTDPTEEDFLATVVANKTKPGRRRKRKATGFQTKQRKKPVKRQLKIDTSLVSDENNANKESNSFNLNSEALTSVLHENEPGLLKTRPAKRKKRQLSKTKATSSDLTPRRSSSRKSKDNAMRLIELQADSNYSGVSEVSEVEEKKPTRKRRKSQSSFALDESDDLDELSGDSTEDYLSDNHDGDYVVDEDELEEPDNDDILEASKKANKEKKLGGLKISIKLSGNSSAEIVSGISDTFTKKKRKTMKKKNAKTKGKDKVKKIEEPNAEISKQIVKGVDNTVENVQESTNSEVNKLEDTGSSTDLKDRHESLIEKYFSTANSATVARQTHKKTTPRKETKKEKKNLDSSKSKLGKNVPMKSIRKQSEHSNGGKQKSSVKFVLDSSAKKDKTEKGTPQEDAEIELPKFVCGYCPQRYHNKQELLAHMEAHMVEMERRNDSEVVPVDDNVKEQLNTITIPVSKVHKSNSTTSENTAEKDKLKFGSESDKDPDLKHSQAASKQKLKCGECGQMFDLKSSLLDHVRIHTADKPFECDICHKCFTERNLLSAHRKTHGQEKLLRCFVCSKAFVDQSDLNVHMQSHPRRSNIKSSGLSIKKSMKKGVQEKQNKETSSVSKKPKSFASALTGDLDTSGKTSDTAPVLILSRRDKPSIEAKNISSTASNKILLGQPVVALKPVTSLLYKPSPSVSVKNVLKKPVEGSLVNSNVQPDSSNVKSDNSKIAKSDSNATVKSEGNLIVKSNSIINVKPDSNINVKSDSNKNMKSEGNKIIKSDSSINFKADSNRTVKSDANKVNSNGVVSSSIIETPEVASGHCTCKECPDCVTRFLQSFD